CALPICRGTGRVEDVCGHVDTRSDRCLIDIPRSGFRRRSVTGDQQEWYASLGGLSETGDGIGESGAVCRGCDPDLTAHTGVGVRCRDRTAFVADCGEVQFGTLDRV